MMRIKPKCLCFLLLFVVPVLASVPPGFEEAIINHRAKLDTVSPFHKRRSPHLDALAASGKAVLSAAAVNGKAVLSAVSADVVALVEEFKGMIHAFTLTVASYISWLDSDWTKSYHELTREAETRYQGIDEDIEELVEQQGTIKRYCHDAPTSQEESWKIYCMEKELEVSDKVREAKQFRRRARELYQSYKDKHNQYNPQYRMA